SGSKDGTETVAGKFGAQWHVQPWLGYVGQKNKLLSLLQHEWAFSIDADEALSPELVAELAALKRGGDPGVNGFSMPRCVNYEGQWIRHGDWYPDRLVRLFRKNSARFAGGKVHERLELQGSVRELEGEIYHYSFRDAADHWTRCEHYARLWAESKHEEGGRSSLFAGPGHALFRFLRSYLFRRGFLDGALGFRIARYAAGEVYLKYETLRRLNRSEEKKPTPEKRGL
ncbi:MAG: glycosyltransferase family 2 protein, partial [Verrucomicrobiota bacterium]|nr:glycosyltransferase family 2 protein [Verrucomicrobiota bacterium]